ncbi:hypothetical protein ACFP81_12955 [Deinococcus lacus]|uniref:Uncharacterized protein n=1 Tax=Deinococcus lacus TaxID=392561 RepID=A0ABW1YEW0_9DEIO
MRLPALAAATLLSSALATSAPLYVAYPPDGHQVRHPAVLLEGSVQPGASLTIGGRSVPVGPDGLFIEWWPLRLA